MWYAIYSFSYWKNIISNYMKSKRKKKKYSSNGKYRWLLFVQSKNAIDLHQKIDGKSSNSKRSTHIKLCKPFLIDKRRMLVTKMLYHCIEISYIINLYCPKLEPNSTVWIECNGLYAFLLNRNIKMLENFINIFVWQQRFRLLLNNRWNGFTFNHSFFYVTWKIYLNVRLHDYEIGNTYERFVHCYWTVDLSNRFFYVLYSVESTV